MSAATVTDNAKVFQRTLDAAVTPRCLRCGAAKVALLGGSRRYHSCFDCRPWDEPQMCGPCARCGQWWAQEDRRKRRYCSPECADLAAPAIYRAWYRRRTNERRLMREPRSCSVCGRGFDARRDAKTCSPRCRQAAYRERTLEANA